MVLPPLKGLVFHFTANVWETFTLSLCVGYHHMDDAVVVVLCHNGSSHQYTMLKSKITSIVLKASKHNQAIGDWDTK